MEKAHRPGRTRKVLRELQCRIGQWMEICAHLGATSSTVQWLHQRRLHIMYTTQSISESMTQSLSIQTCMPNR